MVTKSTRKSAKLSVKKHKVKDLPARGTNKVVGGLARAGDSCCKYNSEVLDPFSKSS